MAPADKPTVVWTEIPVTDLDAAKAFYETVFGWSMTRETMGASETVMFADGNGLHGNLYAGRPAAEGQGPTLHCLLPDALAAGAARCVAAGGALVGEPFEIPPGKFQYAQDPDGNSIGLFEPRAA